MKSLLHYVKQQYLLIVIIVGVVMMLIFFLFNRSDTKANGEDAFETDSFKTMDLEEDLIDDVPLVLMVDVKGAVKLPGVYTFTEGDRIDDAIKRAGGFTEDAEEIHVNLALKLLDEQVIYVPEMGEAPVEIEQYWKEAGDGESGKVNLNTATIEELQGLTGIGPAKAASIVSHREEHGPYQTIDDLKNVSGIGEKSFDSLKDFIEVN
ncbi:helix-hairpin-helix domain-containing protein [Shouchella lehensis]|uniref:Competence protein ComEA n=1 Tax=Shouchella lehensis G1 TaxID=1246626 RepID=A0A060M1V0_9BACI|nr:helix-hairpin-helix domain-containing protein [Shouchella lehensis]AIC94034.1 competence protein ComEA [Shouchella lehensis G1]